jgi:hypothetical protein
MRSPTPAQLRALDMLAVRGTVHATSLHVTTLGTLLHRGWIVIDVAAVSITPAGRDVLRRERRESEEATQE